MPDPAVHGSEQGMLFHNLSRLWSSAARSGLDLPRTVSPANKLSWCMCEQAWYRVLILIWGCRRYNEFDLADRLKSRGWVLPAYRMAPDAQYACTCCCWSLSTPSTV